MEKNSFLKEKIDLKSPNKNITPITTSIGSDGKLSIGGCSIEELVKKYDSPLYILDEITLRNSCRAYKKALEKYYPGESLPIDVVIGTIFLLGLSKSIFCFKKDFFSSMREFLNRLILNIVIFYNDFNFKFI